MSAGEDEPDPTFAQSATLYGVMSRVRRGERGEDDPELRRRLDHAFSKHHAKLRQFVTRELRGLSDEVVEETVQDVLLVAWSKLAGHDGRYFRAWLYEIASLTCANVRRKRREVSWSDGLFEVGSDAESTYAKLRREERSRLLSEAAARALSPKEQEVVYMRYDLELPPEEMARLAGFADPDEVRVTLQRVKRRLTRELEAMLREKGHGSSLLRPDEDRGS